VFFGTGSTTFSGPQGLAVGDINSDGLPDIVLADYNTGLVILRNTTPHPVAMSVPTLSRAALLMVFLSLCVAALRQVRPNSSMGCE
jgi:FG-GAP repeat